MDWFVLWGLKEQEEYIYIYIYKTLAFEGNENLNFIDWIDLMLHFMWRVGWVHCQYKQIMKIIFN